MLAVGAIVACAVGLSPGGAGAREAVLKVLSQPECPPLLSCRFIPAAFRQTAGPAYWGNYSLANRPRDGLPIRYVVVHDSEISYDATIRTFQIPTRYASSHYVIRSVDGQITQMVQNRDVAWHSGNWYFNTHSIGLEHEGVAIHGDTWFTDEMYAASAGLVKYLAGRYHIPLDRAHVVGHDEVPGPTGNDQRLQHWDPGPYWDWAHYLALLGSPLPARGDSSSKIVTVNPDFASNQPPVSYCAAGNKCEAVPPRPSNFVYLRTAPEATAPLFGDPVLHPDGGNGSTLGSDWGDKAVTGQQFVRAGVQGDWDAIYYSGRKLWLYNPGHNTVTAPGSGRVVTPRPGRVSIPVYGWPAPERAAFGRGVPGPTLTSLPYRIPARQSYVVADTLKADYFWNPTAERGSVVHGKARYYTIWFNHRLAFVKATDVRFTTV